MKTFILALGFCLLTTFAFADVTGEAKGKIIAQDLDDRGNIRIWTQYLFEGKEIVSQYLKIDGKSVYVSGRYNKIQFLGMSKTEIAELIDKDINKQCQNLVGQEFDKKAPKTIKQIKEDYNRQANQDFVASSFPILIGREVKETKKTIVLDTDNDGVNDTEITLKADGTKTITPITP